MCILSIDFLSVQHGVALEVSSGDIIQKHGERNSEEKPRIENQIIELVQSILSEADINQSTITDVLVTAGPGSFTGARIGIAAVQGFFQGSTIRAHAINTLDGMISYGKKINGNHQRLITAAVQTRKPEWIVDVGTGVQSYGSDEWKSFDRNSSLFLHGDIPEGLDEDLIYRCDDGLAECLIEVFREDKKENNPCEINELQPLYYGNLYTS
ncbi:MAG: hypothetical protein COB59_12460 [Rhodospirillaceae bacterium]|nr:MAG: hypothetical protein COB59_12460 [Rhodospirillaceae bacterium]